MKSILSTSAILIAMLASLSLNAQAQTADQSQPGSSTANVSDQQAAPKKTTGDIDDEITNARLRAVTGAKSAFSFWSAFSYAGASIQNPFSTLRPQLNSQNNADPTNLSGQVSAKYRITEHDSLIGGVGLQYTPAFTNNAGQAQSAASTLSSPYLDYNRAFRIGAYQNVLDFAVSKYTLSTDLSQNLNWAWSIGHQLMREVGESKRLSFGVADGIAQDVYTADGQDPHSIYLQAYIEPIAEYAVTDKMSLRTVYRMMIFNEIAGTASSSIWTQSPQTESIGVGYAITRDIYVYPNLQWGWTHISADATTVGFSANINL